MDLDPILPFLPWAGAGLGLGLILGAGAAALIAGRRTAEARERAAATEATLDAERRSHAARVEGLEALHAEIEARLGAVADAALRQNSRSFLDSARELFEAQKGALASEAEGKRAALDALLKPVADQLTRYQERLAEVEKARTEAYGGLRGQITQLALAQEQIRAEAQKLSGALRAAPKARGRWGEHQLRTVMEMAGMAEHVDFVTEAGFERDDARLRPDAIIRLPGGRKLVVDAKTSMSAYLDAVAAAEETTRETLLSRHASELRAHVKALGGKAYWQGLDDATDFVVMFVPGENLYAAAIERDPDLFQDAITNRVLITTPTTLIALAKSVALGWQQQAIEQSARQIAALGTELYRRLMIMTEHVAGVGKEIESAAKKYNQLVGSLDDRVLPQARKFRELGIDTGAKDLAELKPVETAVREPRAIRDLNAPRDSAAE